MEENIEHEVENTLVEALYSIGRTDNTLVLAFLDSYAAEYSRWPSN